jgi:hypothetical protein
MAAKSTNRTVRQTGSLDTESIARLLNSVVAHLCPEAPTNAKISVEIDLGSYEMRSADADECEFTYVIEWTETKVEPA